MATLKGIFPEPKPIRRKNFLQENVKNLRRMEQCFHANKEVDEMQKLQLQRHQKLGDKYQNVSAKVNTSFRERKHETNTKDLVENKVENEQQELCRKTSAPMLNKNGVSTKKIINLPTIDKSVGKQKRREQKGNNKNAQRLGAKVLSDPNVSHKAIKSNGECLEAPTIKYKSQGIQTLDTKEEDNIYSEGIIRYPSKKCLKHSVLHDNTETSEQEDGDQKDTTNLPSDRGDIQTSENMYRKSDTRSPELTSPKGEIDFVKLNKERTSVASRMAAQLNSNNVPPTNYRKGVVPKYIRDRKEAQEKEQKAKAEASDPDCPEGHVSLPDHERKETLRMLKKNYQDYVNELNMMPIKMDTLRVQKRKIEIEKQLNKLEEGIKVFSRPKVYVKVNG